MIYIYLFDDEMLMLAVDNKLGIAAGSDKVDNGTFIPSGSTKVVS